MECHDIIIGMAGSGGDGVVSAGDILVASAANEGIHCLMLKSFGPQIRGGESSCRICLSTSPVLSQGDLLDVLVVFNWPDYSRFGSELQVKDNTYILVEEKDKTENIPLENPDSRKIIRIPFERLAQQDAGNPKAKNFVTLGVLCEMFGLPTDGIKKAIERKFKKKGPEIVAANSKAIDVGIAYVKNNCKPADIRFAHTSNKQMMAITGNEATAFAALAAGCRFFASYPITPATEIMEWLVREMPKFGGTVLQAEDEISAINAVVGASFGGVRAMTATSGPGMSLKLEAIGLASMAELPIVVVDVQRGGPSTGIPTKSEQADLMQSIYGTHGDAAHAVLAPADVEDCFDVTWRAFKIAEEYQMPVIILSDQFIGHRKETIAPFDLNKIQMESRVTPDLSAQDKFKRYLDTKSGVSPITWPGITAGEYLASGIEHTEDGSPSSQHETHEKMTIKRAKKIEMLANQYKFIRRYGPSKADVGVIAWGSTKGVVRQAVEKINKNGFKVAALIPQLIYPLQKADIKKFVSECKQILVVELSYSGQFMHYLNGESLLPLNAIYYRSSGGRVFSTVEIEGAIRAAAEGQSYKSEKYWPKMLGKDEE